MTHGYGRDWAPDEPEPPRRIPQPPPPARHVAPAGGTPAPTSPVPMSPPPVPRRPPPNNAAGLPPAYPAMPPPVPTSPSVPRSPGPFGPGGQGGPGLPPGARMPGPPPRGPAGPMLGPRGRTQAPPQAPRRRLGPNRTAKRRPPLPPLPQTKGIGLPGLLRQLPQHKPWMITISVISVLVVLGACGFGSWQLIRQDGDPVGVVQAGPTVERRDISSREVDNAPLTVEIVFPTKEVAAAEPDLPPYTMVGEPQTDDDCRYVGDDQVKSLLGTTVDPTNPSSGPLCSQFIRASFLSYDNRYHATIGVLNLPDMQAANDVAQQIKDFGENGEGTLTGYVSDPHVNTVLFSAPPHLHMEVYGHFLLYGIVVHKDGSQLASDDQGAKVVVYDLVQTYLLDVIKNWAIVPAGSGDETQPTATGSPTG